MYQKHYVAGGIFGDLEALDSFVTQAESDGADSIILLGNYTCAPSEANDWVDLLCNSVGRTNTTLAREVFKARRSEYVQGALQNQKKILDASGIPYQVLPGNRDDNSELVSIFGNSATHNTVADMGTSKVLSYGSGGFYTSDHIEFTSRLHEMGLCNDYNQDELEEILERIKPQIFLAHQTPEEIFDFQMTGYGHTGSQVIRNYIQKSMPLWVTSSVNNWQNGKEGDPRSGTVIDKQKGLRTLVLNPGFLGRANSFNLYTLDPSPMPTHYGSFFRLVTDENGLPYDYTIFIAAKDGRQIKKAEPIGANFVVKQRSSSVNLSSEDSRVLLVTGGFDPISKRLDDRVIRELGEVDQVSRPLKQSSLSPDQDLSMASNFKQPILGEGTSETPFVDFPMLPIVKFEALVPILEPRAPISVELVDIRESRINFQRIPVEEVETLENKRSKVVEELPLRDSVQIPKLEKTLDVELGKSPTAGVPLLNFIFPQIQSTGTVERLSYQQSLLPEIAPVTEQKVLDVQTPGFDKELDKQPGYPQFHDDELDR